MAGSLAALKTLPCPAGDKCTAFQCLFKHDIDTDSTIAITNSEQPVTLTLAASDTTQDLPRKRVKLDSTRAAPSPVARQTEPQETTPERTQIKRQKVAMSSVDELASRKMEPPLPIGRQPQSSAKGAGQDISSSSKVQDSKSNSASPSAPQTRPIAKPGVKASNKAAPKKPETLNPRLLKQSPAQHNTRIKLVKALHEQYARLNLELKKEAKDDASKNLLLSDQELIVKTLDDEQEMAIKKFKIYGNAIRNRIGACKKMTVAKWKEERLEATKATNGEETENASPPIVVVTGLTTAQEIDFVHRLVSPLDGLTAFGYVASIPSDEDIRKAKESVAASGNVEVCDRCTRRFQVFPGRREEDGALASNGSCTFHPGKFYYGERGPGKHSSAPKKYRCCHQNFNDESGGCTTASTHVFKTSDPNRLASLLNFAETPPNPAVPVDRAVGFDCEMGYTTYGLELIRLTLVSWPDGERLLDVLVQPYGEILDLNTRYSGVTPEAMVTAERWKPGDDHKPASAPSSDTTKSPEQKENLKLVPSPKVARDLLFSMISPDTPLIGHGLENDLNAVRIIHPTCVDTVLLYPHHKGLPIRHGLKHLMERLLNRKIQVETDDDRPEGHDSAEDARAAGELVRLKVRDDWCDLQWKGWKLKDGEIVPPGS
ncbi:hypothetical protein F4821DRAFT_225156 [Hypoxylon rubiginosum]|uniref:Uncharacterized protein n=1 Tax=Hypoxylon rubiginosum TaxID=110542 RepID=A0ACC0DHI6_9PEZI|nr:hypothetical protein F4821DRAFT_225156 [Hypoxylon rubiginosum]